MAAVASSLLDESGILDLERRMNTGSGMLSVKWRWLILCSAMGIVGMVGVFTDDLDPQTVSRFSVDSRWDRQPSSDPTKAMTDEEKERAGLGKQVHTFHVDGDVHVANKKGAIPATLHRDIEQHMNGPGLDKYQFPHGLPEAPPPEALLSEHKVVTTDVKGNLGPGSVIVDSKNKDWLRDRWQAAADMQGTPIPGAHWVIIDLGKPAQLSRVVLDWETAFAKGYDIEVSDEGKLESVWRKIYTTTDANGEQASPKHVVHSIVLGGSEEVSIGGRATGQEKLDDAVHTERQGRYVRIAIPANGLGTQYGASLWEVRIFGMWV